jgi:site-specific DNA-adenine methylase
VTEPIKYDGRSAPLFKRPHVIRGIRPPFKMPGGKYYLAPIFANRGIAPRPAHTYFVGCGGAASELLCWEPPKRTVYNDADPIKYCVFRAIQEKPEQLLERLRKVHCTEDEFEQAKSMLSVLDAYAREVSADEFVKTVSDDFTGVAAARIIASRFSVNALCLNFAWSERLRGGKPEQVNAWETFVASEFAAIARRVQSWILLNLDVTEATERVITAERSEGHSVFAYYDPPYLKETVGKGNLYGDYMMNDSKHSDLLSVICTQKHSEVHIAISGYDSALYRDWLEEDQGWHRHEVDIASQMRVSASKDRRTEIVWTSYPIN